MKKFYLAAIISLLYVPVVTIVAELVAPFKTFIKSVFWHHWLGKSVILIVLFCLLSLVFSRTKDHSPEAEGKFLTAVTVVSLLSGASVFVFFVYEYSKQL